MIHRLRAALVASVAIAIALFYKEVGSTAIECLKSSGVFLSTGYLPGWSGDHVMPTMRRERVFSLEELRNFDGSLDSPTGNNPRGPNGEGDVFLSIGGIVFDVTEKGRQFYGVGQHYHCFAAAPVSRALTIGSLEIADIELGDSVEDLTERQISDLRVQVQFYSEKYIRVGVLEYRDLMMDLGFS